MEEISGDSEKKNDKTSFLVWSKFKNETIVYCDFCRLFTQTMTSSSEKKVFQIYFMIKIPILIILKKRKFETRINDIPEIDKIISILTADKINDIVRTFIKILNGTIDPWIIEEKQIQLQLNVHLWCTSIWSMNYITMMNNY